MKNRKTVSKMLIAMSMILDMVSFIIFLIYFYSANHAPYNYTEVIFA